MILDFPSSPSTGQLYPSPPATGLPVYKWDGEKWLFLSSASGGAGIFVSDTPPAGASDNSLWWESDTGMLYVRYNDGDSAQWVVAMPPSGGGSGGGISDAPNDGQAYNRKSLAWAVAASGGASVYVQDTPPAAAVAGSLWWKSDAGLLYILYNDGDSTQWVVAVATPDTSTFIAKSGDTMAGPLVLPGNPTTALQAAPKQYVDGVAVRYDAVQALSGAQQIQARNNILAPGVIKIQKFIASGTYTPSTGMQFCIIEAVGGGGGGAGVPACAAAQGTCGGGGGAGGYARKLATAALIGASQIVTIGALGAGGAAGVNAGGAGGGTSVGSLVVTTGGGGGQTVGASVALYVISGGTSGGASAGDILGAGQPGNPGMTLGGVSMGGNGGASAFGGGGASGASAPGSAASANSGAGGGGGSSQSGGGATAGGNGGAGCVIITEFCTQ